jgi:hypothetical protein
MSLHYSFDCVQTAASDFAAAYPVYTAAAHGDVDELRRIIGRGADVNQALKQVII